MKLKPHIRGLSATIAVTGLLLLAGCTGPAWMGFAEPAAPTVTPSQAYLDARTALLQSAQDRDPVTRANAVEALSTTLGAEAGEVYMQGLSDQTPVVRLASAMAIGDVKYAPALPTLRRMVQDNKTEPQRAEPDKRVFCSLLYALHTLGDDAKTGELATLLFDEQPEVRMDSAMAMGKMGAPSAIGPLNSVLSNEREEGVKIQLTESLAMLGDSRSAEVLEAFTKGYFLDLRLLAITAISRTGSERAIRVLNELTAEREPARVRVKAAGELARLGLGNAAMLSYCLRAVREPAAMLKESVQASRRAADSDVGSLKLLGIIAAGWFGDEKIVNDLHPLLKDPEGPTRVASAASILRLLRGYKPLTVPAAVPPAAVPPEAVPPAAVPPEAVPPEAVPPAAVPPATAPQVPPAVVPPAIVPPAIVPPTMAPKVPPAIVPPAMAPQVPPAVVPPTTAPQVPPAVVPPTTAPQVPPTVVPPAIVSPTMAPKVLVAPPATTSAPAAGDVSEIRLVPIAPEIRLAPEGPATRPQLHTAGGKD